MNCVYIIRHPFTDLFYIGSTGNFIKRQINHRSKLRRGQHYNERLQYAYNLDRSLTWEVTETATREEAALLELQMIHGHRDNPNLANRNGTPHTEDTKEAMSEAWTEERRQERSLEVAKYWTSEFYQEKSEQMTGTKASQETKDKMSASRKGSLKSTSWANKMAESRRQVVSIQGVIYPSITAASDALNVPINTIKHRVKSSNAKFADWQFSTL